MLKSIDLVLDAFLSKSVPYLSETLKKLGVKSYDNMIVSCTNAFYGHMKDTESRCKSIKTLINRLNPEPLLDAYVNMFFETTNSKILEDKLFVDKIQQTGGRYFFIGTAGSGKSIFMKWLCLNLIDGVVYHRRIPLFIEIRNLIDRKIDVELEELIFSVAGDRDSPANFGQFKIGLENGLFILVLDGLDEFPPKDRYKLLKRLTKFSLRYPRSTIVASSRPDPNIEYLANFFICKICPLTIEQSCKIISLCKIDEEKKTRFILELENGMFEKYSSFLSIPLLLIVMMITFSDNGIVLESFSAFYSDAFDALYNKHDLSKDGFYLRNHSSGLSKSEFRRIFETFSFLSYVDDMVTMNYEKASDICKESLIYNQADIVKTDDFLKDALQAVCLLQEDGNQISFIHRSFQEYFVACFIGESSDDEIGETIEIVSFKSNTDRVIPLLAEMHNFKVTEFWLIPSLEKIIEEMKEFYARPEFFFIKHVDIIFIDSFTSNIIGMVYKYSSPLSPLSKFSGSIGRAGFPVPNCALFEKGALPIHESPVRVQISAFTARVNEFEGHIMSIPVEKSIHYWSKLSFLARVLPEFCTALEQMRSSEVMQIQQAKAVRERARKRLKR